MRIFASHFYIFRRLLTIPASDFGSLKTLIVIINLPFYHLKRQKYARSISSRVSIAAINAIGRNIPASVPVQNARVKTPNIFAVKIKGFFFKKHLKFVNVLTSVLYGI